MTVDYKRNEVRYFELEDDASGGACWSWFCRLGDLRLEDVPSVQGHARTTRPPDQSDIDVITCNTTPQLGGDYPLNG